MKLFSSLAAKPQSFLNASINKSAATKKLMLVLTAFICISHVHAQTLIAYYPLNENAKDASGNHFDGVISGRGVVFTTDRNGNADSAANFLGISGKIDVPDAPALRPVDFTVSVWFYLTQYPNQYKSIVAKNLCNGTHESFALQITPNNYIEGIASDGNSSISLSGVLDNVHFLNSWQLVTMSFDHTHDSVKLYIDGILTAGLNTSLNVKYDTSAFSIGDKRENCADNYFFNGKIDDVRLYNGVLSSKQISQLFDSNIHSAGSGRAIQFSGIVDHAVLPSGMLNNYRVFTIEYWIKTTENNSDSIYWKRPTMIGNSTVLSISQEFGITTDNGRIGMWANSTPGNFILTGTKINDNKWHHIAAVNDGSKIVLYVDGILQSGSVQSGFNLKTSVHPFYFGASNGGALSHQGEYDELRLWNTALTKQEIRDRMCRKITSSDPLYSYLLAYYNFDEENKHTAFDIVNYNNAELFDGVDGPQRPESDAPIGDSSADVYGNGLKTVSINALSGETFTVNSSSGRTSGLHVYVVNESPQYLRGVDTLCNQNKYFGVFQANDKQDVYSAVYNYAANPCVNALNESALRVYQKPGPDSNYWYQLPYVPNTTLNTITINDIQDYNAKFILGLDTASSFTTAGKNNAATGKHLFSASLFPNPASSQLNIYINVEGNDLNLNKSTLQVTDIAGKVLINREVDALNKQNVFQLNVSPLIAGTYFIKIVDNNGNVKAIKQFIKN